MQETDSIYTQIEETLEKPAIIKSKSGQGLELRQFLQPLLRWWWALLVVPMLSGGVSFFLMQNAPSYYQARALFNIGPSVKEIQNEIPPLVTLRLSISYSQIVQEDTFLSLVIRQSGINLSVDQLRQITVVQFVEGTPFFEIHVVDSGSKRVLQILQTMSDLLISDNAQVQELRLKSQKSFIAARQTELAALINENQQQLDQFSKQAGVDGETSGRNIEIQKDVSTIKSQLDSYNQELSELHSLTNSAVPNQIHVVEQPHLIQVALGPQPKAAVIAMSLLALAVVVFFIFLLEFFNSRVTSLSQVEELLGQNVLFVGKRKQKVMREQFDLLAAELIAEYTFERNEENPKILVVYEQNTAGVRLALFMLTHALNDMGVQVSTTMNISEEENAQELIETLVTKDEVEDEGLKRLDQGWEIFCLSWPASVRNLGLLSTTYNNVIILCSLKLSRKKYLVELATSLATINPVVSGVVLL